VTKRPGYAMTVPLVVLAFLSIVGGYLKGPLLGFLDSVLPPTIEAHAAGLTEAGSEAVAAIPFLIGLYFAYLFHLQKRGLADTLVANPAGRAFERWWFTGWGFDWIYDKAFVQPFVWVSQINKSDFVDSFYTGVARLTGLLYRGLSDTETGRVRWYAAAMAGGAVVFLAVVLFWSSRAQSTQHTWIAEENWNWVPSFGIHFHLAVDGLSLLMLRLTFFLGIVSVLASWTEIREKVGFFHFNLLWFCRESWACFWLSICFCSISPGN